ncbi:MAG TPA: metalloregulator ArsR/SmtB family transcription factor [Thermomicrobiales bacterium]|jgi:DNA-binding transcriptional ArsR family regulator|nr:metalloregulator ArsR/SmtB family transcription factor [Thermomicrobiales bacterium]
MAERSLAQDDDRAAVVVFAALGDSTRLALIRRLGDGRSHPIAQLANDLPQTRQAITRHLAVLEQAGIVTGEHVGREHRYQLRPDGLRTGRDYLDRAASQWDDALDRLRHFLDDDPTDRGDTQ